MKFRVLCKIPIPGEQNANLSPNDHVAYFYQNEIIDLALNDATPLLEKGLIEHAHQRHPVERVSLKIRNIGRGKNNGKHQNSD